MPDKRPPTRKRTWITPVIAPASAPAISDAGRLHRGFRPPEIISAVTAAPSGKLESTVISGKSRILNVMYTPNARMA